MTFWLAAGLVLVAYVAGALRGYNDGVRETERRWSDAVGRADRKEP